ncbi:MAG: hypothetical protein MMC23_009505 [Stictis urceolatum]|nr:hypothetical protein [Stictis urceolata]
MSYPNAPGTPPTPTSLSSPSPLVLLTGATGFIGFETLLTLLTSPYPNVRLAVRDPAKASTLLTNPALSALLSSPSSPLAPTFAHVPSITAPGAYSSAIKDVTHVIHIASPLPMSNPAGHLTAQESYIAPAVRGALEILEAAHATPTVKSVVITSSVTALIPSDTWRARETSQERFGPWRRNENWGPEYEDEAEAYGASKTAQQVAVEEWVEAHRPAFEVVTVHPSWVFGRAEICSTSEELGKGTNKFLLGAATGVSPFGEWRRLSGACVSVGDVARAHVLALGLGRDGEEEGNGNGKGSGKVRRFALSTEARFEDIPGIVGREFPDEVREGLLSVEGKQRSSPLKYDGSEAEKMLGFRYETMEEMLKGLLAQYVGLKKKESA